MSPLILIAGASVRWAAQSSRHAGYQVVGADLFGDEETRSACQQFVLLGHDDISNPSTCWQKLREIADKHECQLIQVGGFSSSGSSIEDASISVAQLTGLQSLASRCGFSVPETRFLTDPKPSKGDLTRHWLVKTFGSSGGQGVYRASQAKLSQNDSAYYQRHITGRPFGLIALASKSTVSLLGMTREIVHRSSHHRFQYGGSVGPIQVPHEVWNRMHQLATLIAKSHELNGLFNLDWVRDPAGQWWFLELNARPSASCEVLERSLWAIGQLDPSISLMGLHTAAILDKVIEPPNSPDLRSNDATIVKKIVYSRCSGYWNSSQIDRSLGRLAADSNATIELMDRPKDGTRLGCGHPIATLIYQPANNSLGSLGSRLTGSGSTGSRFWGSLRKAVRLVELSVQNADA